MKQTDCIFCFLLNLIESDGSVSYHKVLYFIFSKILSRLSKFLPSSEKCLKNEQVKYEFAAAKLRCTQSCEFVVQTLLYYLSQAHTVYDNAKNFPSPSVFSLLKLRDRHD